MGSSIYVAASGAEARLRQLELVANNLANANTDGYKADRAAFQSFFQSALSDQDGERTQGPAGGVYVAAGAAGFDQSAGPVRRTGAALDVAIEGEGYFVVGTEQGERYSRVGSFSVNSKQQLVGPHGKPVLGDGGPIQVSGTQTRILGNGDIVDSDDATVGTLRVVTFGDKQALFKQGDGLFAAKEGHSPKAVDTVTLVEGSVESSNVQPTAEMANLVILQRAFEAAIQAMQRDDEATGRLIREISQ